MKPAENSVKIQFLENGYAFPLTIFDLCIA